MLAFKLLGVLLNTAFTMFNRKASHDGQNGQTLVAAVRSAPKKSVGAQITPFGLW